MMAGDGEQMYIFRDCRYEDSSGDIVFRSIDGIKAYLLEQGLDGLWYVNEKNPAAVAVVEWDGSEGIELTNDDFQTIFAADPIEVRP